MAETFNENDIENRSDLRLLVIGASAGGMKAVKECLSGIQARKDTAFLVVLHTHQEAPAVLDQHFSRQFNMPVKYAENGQEVEGGKVLLAPPDRHLMLKDDKILLTRGPKENLFRPSIDVLFRSAAVAFGNRVIGVLLSGRLNDGTLGLSAIKRCGGITMIQNPASAEYGDMPLLAQQTVDPDYTLLLEDMPGLFARLLNEPIPPAAEIPAVLKKEVFISSHTGKINDEKADDKDGDPFSCPSCGGPLRLMENEVEPHYVCRTGHSFTMPSLDEGQDRQLEETLWIALRVLNERLTLLKKMINDYDRKGLDMLAKTNQQKLEEVEQHTFFLKRLMGLQEETGDGRL